MTLKELFTVAGLPEAIEARFAAYAVDYLSCDSRDVRPNSVFVALSGFKSNGADFIKDVLAQGIKIIVYDRKAGITMPAQDVAAIAVDDPKAVLRRLSAAFYGRPSALVKVIGITGTNGKTTITYLLESILARQGALCGVLGTVNYRIGQELLPSTNTTPGFLDVQRFLFRLQQAKVPYAVMEASSHALHQGRLDGIDFAAAIFTNLTQDHLDYHPSMEDYFQAKSLLFTRLGPQAVALINADDAYGRRLFPLTKAKVFSYAIDAKADMQAVNIKYQLSGTEFELIYPNGRSLIKTPLVGRHNVYNILAAASCAYGLGVPMETIQEGVSALSFIPGRLESVQSGSGVFVFIDYAHTEDGLINVLQALRQVTQDKIIVVFGCGGNRDKLKRPKMGRAVSELADFAIVTSDNPRLEDPQAIINDIIVGMAAGHYEICVDRKEAIVKALQLARPGQIVLLAGKGHETYQIFKDKTVDFNERRIVEDYFNNVHH